MDGQISLHGVGTDLACRISLSFIRSVKDMSSSLSWEENAYGWGYNVTFQAVFQINGDYGTVCYQRLEETSEKFNKTQLFKQSLKSFLHFEIKTE